MSAGERPLTHNRLCDFVKQAAVGLSPIEGGGEQFLDGTWYCITRIRAIAARWSRVSGPAFGTNVAASGRWKSASRYARQQTQ